MALVARLGLWGLALQGHSGAASLGILRGWVSGVGAGRPGRDRARSSGLVENLTTPHRGWGKMKTKSSEPNAR